MATLDFGIIGLALPRLAEDFAEPPDVVAWVALTHNLVRDFQLHAGIATPRRNTRKRTARRLFRTMRTLRFEWIHLPARVSRPRGCAQLRIAAAPTTRERIDQAIQQLAA